MIGRNLPDRESRDENDGVQTNEDPVNFPKLLLSVVVTHVDSEVEDDWNEWYDTVHLPQVLACPGFVEGRRYAAIESRYGSSDTYLTLYHLDSTEALQTPEFLSVRGWDQYEDSVDASISLFRRMDT